MPPYSICRSWILGSTLLAVGCAPPPAPPKEAPPPPPPPVNETPPAPPAPEPVEADKDCIKGTALCDAGVCTVELKSTCEAPVTCEVTILAYCKGERDTRQARGTESTTVLPGKSAKLETGGNCEGAMVVATQAEKLACK